jgi:Na+/H+-translocating membrane pyrophosphatase
MKEATDLSYLSALYYTAAVLLILTAVFAAVSKSWWMAGVCFILGSVLLGYLVRGLKEGK